MVDSSGIDHCMSLDERHRQPALINAPQMCKGIYLRSTSMKRKNFSLRTRARQPAPEVSASIGPRAKALSQVLEESISGGVLDEVDGKGQGATAFVTIDLAVVHCTPLPNRGDDELDVLIGQ
ncbi:hypothetical protein HFO27_30505 [Rhizobium leguminosarum]|nr:hypothetical protein [Rhizobium leguminosarum]MBY5623995.1 hypothetical protein [Rhizobium leguminosarum]MBY5645785.1 hypothetical protein [Rhizobium leguminosarum]